VSRVFLLTIIAVTLLTMACVETYTPKERQKKENEPEFIIADELFVTEQGEEGETRTVFSTNDKKYWGYEGLTMWTVRGEPEEIFTSRTVTMAKSSGYSGGGYGIVFCHGEYEIEDKLETAMYVVMINNNGQYIFGKAVGGVFTDYGWWKNSPCLNPGTGASNEVAVSYEEEEYILSINGTEVERFSSDGEPELFGGKNGYIAVITPFDRFPESSVEIYYMEGQ